MSISLDEIKRAVMSTLGISYCTSTTLKRVSGDCSPISKGAECQSCAGTYTQTSLCAIISQTFGKILRRCDANKTSAGKITKTGGCNSMKLKRDNVDCSKLDALCHAMYDYIHSISTSISMSSSSGGIMVNDMSFNVVNTHCKSVNTSMSAAHYPQTSVGITDQLAVNTQHVLMELLKFLKDFFTGSGVDFDSIIEEISDGELPLGEIQSDIEVRVSKVFNFQNILDIDIINSWIDGQCTANQSIVFNDATTIVIDSCLSAFTDKTPSLKTIPLAFDAEELKRPSWILWTVAAVIVVVVILSLAVAGVRSRSLEKNQSGQKINLAKKKAKTNVYKQRPYTNQPNSKSEKKTNRIFSGVDQRIQATTVYKSTQF